MSHYIERAAPLVPAAKDEFIILRGLIPARQERMRVIQRVGVDWAGALEEDRRPGPFTLLSVNYVYDFERAATLLESYQSTWVGEDPCTSLVQYANAAGGDIDYGAHLVLNVVEVERRPASGVVGALPPLGGGGDPFERPLRVRQVCRWQLLQVPQPT